MRRKEKGIFFTQGLHLSQWHRTWNPVLTPDGQINKHTQKTPLIMFSYSNQRAKWLRNASTNSSGAADPTYDALTEAHQQAKDDSFENDALIRGTLESYRMEPDNVDGTRKTATTPPARAATTPAALPSHTKATQGHKACPARQDSQPHPLLHWKTFSAASRSPAHSCIF